MKKKNIIEAPMGETEVLLHTCCAPCSSAIIEALMQNGITPVIYYCNPNIYPREEYEIRKNECTRYAQSLGLEIIDTDYDHVLLNMLRNVVFVSSPLLLPHPDGNHWTRSMKPGNGHVHKWKRQSGGTRTGVKMVFRSVDCR